jgi:hypothetical protein
VSKDRLNITAWGFVGKTRHVCYRS